MTVWVSLKAISENLLAILESRKPISVSRNVVADYLLAIFVSQDTIADRLLTIGKTRKAISVSWEVIADYLLTVSKPFLAISIS